MIYIHFDPEQLMGDARKEWDALMEAATFATVGVITDYETIRGMNQHAKPKRPL